MYRKKVRIVKKLIQNLKKSELQEINSTFIEKSQNCKK